MKKESKQADCLSFRLDKEISDRLQKFCEDSGFSKTKVVERSLDEFLKKNTVNINGVNAIVLGRPGEHKANPMMSPSPLLPKDEVKGLSNAKKGERLILTKNHSIFLNKGENLNTLVIGSAGNGVYNSFVKPNLLDMPRNTSFVITDKGGEIWKDTHETMEKAGYNVIYFNPYDMEHTLKYSPLGYCKTEEDAREIAETLYELTKMSESSGDIWETAGKNLLTAIILLMFEGEGDDESKLISKIPERIGRFLFDKDVEKYYEKCEEENQNPIFRNKYGCSKTMSERTSAAITANLKEQLKVMGEDKFKELTSCDELKIHTLPEQKTIIYIGFGTIDKTYDFLSRMVLAECIKEVHEKAIERPQPYHVRFMLNDFTEIGDIRKELEQFPMILATNRVYGMSFQMIIQNIAQLIDLYGKEMCNLIRINCSYVLLFDTDTDAYSYFTKASGGIINVMIGPIPKDKVLLLSRDSKGSWKNLTTTIDEKYWLPAQEEPFDIKLE